jgi:hypothetical protein
MPKPRSWTRLDPGVYRDDAGSVHVFVNEILEAYSWEDTAINRALIERAARDAAMAEGLLIVEQEDNEA